MKKIILSFITSLFIVSAFAGEPEGIELKSAIKTVTVFTNGAQVKRTVTTNLSKGVNTLKFIGLTPDIDEQTIKIKGNISFTLLSVNKYSNYLETTEQTSKIKTLKSKVNSLKHEIAVASVEYESLKAEEDLLLANKSISQKNASFVNDLRTMMELYRNRLKEVKMKIMEFTEQLKIQREELTKLKNELAQLNANGKKKHTGEIAIVIDVKNAMPSVEFELTYITPNAGWFSTYDLAVKDIQSPINITHRANIYQTTGVEWKDIRLTLSTNDPYESAVKPVLRPWWLDFGAPRFQTKNYYGTYNPNIRQVSGTMHGGDGEPLVGGNVFVVGTNVGAVADINGRYKITIPAGATTLGFSYVGYSALEMPISSTVMDVVLPLNDMMLDEVVVLGLSRKDKPKRLKKEAKAPAPPPIVQKENITSITYEIDTPFSVPADGQNRTLAIQDFQLKTDYDYFTVPKLNEAAFLTAHVTEWDELSLTNGNANIIFENVFVGKIFIDFQNIEDTLDISLGKDNNIVVKRKPIKAFTKSKTIGFKKTETKAYEIEIRNKKSAPVNITIQDQFPISRNSKIDIKYLENSKAEFDEEKGFLTWKTTIPAHQKHTVQMKYSVKYPKNKRVYLGN